jgi:ABC-type uncharacterized transport system substrate-binding protein
MQTELTGDKTKTFLLGTQQKLVVKQNVYKYTQYDSTLYYDIIYSQLEAICSPTQAADHMLP